MTNDLTADLRRSIADTRAALTRNRAIVREARALLDELNERPPEKDKDTDASTRLHDGRGGIPGHRAGFVLSRDESLAEAAELAYQERKASLGRLLHGHRSRRTVPSSPLLTATLSSSVASAFGSKA
jgi:hypothetical protein